MLIRGVCKGLGKAQDQPLHAWHCGRGKRADLPCWRWSLPTWEVGGWERWRESCRALQGRHPGSGPALPAPCVALLALPPVMPGASPCPVHALLCAAKQRFGRGFLKCQSPGFVAAEWFGLEVFLVWARSKKASELKHHFLLSWA